jgi:Phosphotransferase enzyme family
MIVIEQLQTYLRTRFDPTLQVLSVQALNSAANKSGNFTSAYRADIQDAHGQTRSVVVKQIVATGFGLEEPEDRVRHLLWCYRAYTELPRHPNALDIGFNRSDTSWVSLADSQEFFLIEEYVEGSGYYLDLEQMLARRQPHDRDNARCEALAVYLSTLHHEKRMDAGRYLRALRELIGGGEGVIGLIDGYPPDFKQRHSQLLLTLQQRCLERVWQLAQVPGRVCQSHGDFHPWNILFRSGVDFSVIDRSRSCWNDPAADVGSMLMNYLFVGLREPTLRQSAGLQLASRFLETYLAASNDYDILTTLGPQLAMRSLAVASPVFYPHIPEELRIRLFTLALHIAQSQCLPQQVDQWLDAA